MSTIKPRIKTLLWIIVVIIIGLLSRKISAMYPTLIGNYFGDFFWSVMVFLGVQLILNDNRVKLHAIITLIVSVSVEFLQLYHTPWLDSIRSHRIGRLALGNGFDPYDLIAYTLGTLSIYFTKTKTIHK